AGLARGSVAEVAKDRRPQAADRVSVRDHPAQLLVVELFPAFDFGRIERNGGAPRRIVPSPLDQSLASLHIAVVPDQRRICPPCGASRAANLLVIGLERSGDVDMAHDLDVGSIDAHAKRVGRTYDAGRSGYKRVLHAGAFDIAEAGVVRRSRDTR